MTTQEDRSVAGSSYCRVPLTAGAAQSGLHRHRRRVRAGQVGDANLPKSARVRLSGQSLSGQSAPRASVGQPVLSGSRLAAGAAAACHGDRAGAGGADRDRDRGQSRAQERHHLREPDRRGPRSRDRGAWRRSLGVDRGERSRRLRAQLHGRQCATRKIFRLSQHRIVPADARLGRHGHAIRRHAAISRPGRSAARGEIQLHDLERQRDQSRSCRLCQFPGRGHAHQGHLVVHRRHQAAASLHGGRGQSLGGRQADHRDQDRQIAEVARQRALPYRRDLRRLRRLHGHVRTLRHHRLSDPRRHGGR